MDHSPDGEQRGQFPGLTAAVRHGHPGQQARHRGIWVRLAALFSGLLPGSLAAPPALGLEGAPQLRSINPGQPRRPLLLSLLLAPAPIISKSQCVWIDPSMQCFLECILNTI